jgi:hypothetical protein
MSEADEYGVQLDAVLEKFEQSQAFFLQGLERFIEGDGALMVMVATSRNPKFTEAANFSTLVRQGIEQIVQLVDKLQMIVYAYRRDL